MTDAQAIKILKNYIGTGPEPEPVDLDRAIARGIKALSYRRSMAHQFPHLARASSSSPEKTL